MPRNDFHTGGGAGQAFEELLNGLFDQGKGEVQPNLVRNGALSPTKWRDLVASAFIHEHFRKKGRRSTNATAPGLGNG